MLEVRPDWERAAELGISPGDLGYTVWAYSDGAFVDEFFLDDDEIDIFLYSTAGNIERPQDLERLMLYSPAAASCRCPRSRAWRDRQHRDHPPRRRRPHHHHEHHPARRRAAGGGRAPGAQEIIDGMPASGELPEQIR
jgi:hypothetical protein